MIKNIIFDFDGVIVDSEVLASKAFAKYFIEKGYNVNEIDFYQYAGMKTVQVIDEVVKKYDVKDKNKFKDEIFDIALDYYENDLELIAGIKKFLERSKCSHFIGSNRNKDSIIDGLERVNLLEFFKTDKIYSFDMVKNPKPAPDIYLKAVEENNLINNETVIIEDSLVGVTAALAAGIKVVGITAGSHWHSSRNVNELLVNSDVMITNNYNNLDQILEDF